MTQLRVYAALLHHPVLDRDGNVVSTSVTNMDVHDIARAARTYGLQGYFLVAPLEVQRRLVDHIARHWVEGPGTRRIPGRSEAMRLIRALPDLGSATSRVEEECGAAPVVWATCARERTGTLGYAEARDRLRSLARPLLLVFGTGHGLAEAVLDGADAVLAPIGDPRGWNHLSVRSAASVVLDRLFGN